MHNNKNISKQFSKRSLTRLIAVQGLYQYDFYQKEIAIDFVCEQMVENYFLSGDEKEQSSYQNKIDKVFLNSLISGVVVVLLKIDEEIKLLLKDGWKIEDLPDVMLSILRLAIFELKFMKDIPKKVIMNEYVDLAACFYEKKKVTFVNSFLQNIADISR